MASGQTNRPIGCFWDKNGQSYFNIPILDTQNLNWGGVGGICRNRSTTVLYTEYDILMELYQGHILYAPNDIDILYSIFRMY